MATPPAVPLSERLRNGPAQYQPISRIAVGGMAEVWRADAIFESGERFPVAIKRVLPQMGDAVFRSMFEDEARLGMLLRHPNIVQVHDARDIGGTFIMVMELVDGDMLKGLLDPAFERERPMPLASALLIARDLARALHYAHNAVDAQGKPLNVIHRDVSPHNLLLGKDGGIKLTDFGLADADNNEAARGENMVGGKLGYLAPELIHQKPTDHRIDIFALGIVLWEMLAGRRLFQREDDVRTVKAVAACEVPPITSINGRVPKVLEKLLGQLLAKDPDARTKNARIAAKQLEAVLDRVDSEVSYDDIALMVGLHVARKARLKGKQKDDDAIGVAELLAQEMAQFAAQAQGRTGDMGAQPLDPDAFGGLGSSVRRRPRG